MSQLSLFGGGSGDEAPPFKSGQVEPNISEEDREVAANVPAFVRFGTSSWSFPGWSGIVWKGAPSEQLLARAGLEAYARHPLFRAVGLDRSYYGPLRAVDLASYKVQLESARDQLSCSALPPFRMVAKVWDEITTAVFPRHPRYGARAGMANPHFLDVERFGSEVLAPYLETGFAQHHAGPFVFELTPMPQGALDERTLITRVDDFISHLPADANFRWSFELRNAELFGQRWIDMLRANGVGHVFTYWTAMPPLRDQLRATLRSSVKTATTTTVIRLMLPPYTKYASRKADFAPFDKIAEPQPEMRDDVIDILRAAMEAGASDGVVLVNNKAEGSAPLTIRALAKKASQLR